VPLGNQYVNSFTVTSTGPGSSHPPLTNGHTFPYNNTVWAQPLGYGSVFFTEPVNINSLGRFSAMLIPQTGGVTTGGTGYADVPLNAKLAFNPNTNDLVIVPTTGILPNGKVELFAISSATAQNGDTLINPRGTLPIYSSFLLKFGTSSAIGSRTSATNQDAAAHNVTLPGGPRRHPQRRPVNQATTTDRTGRLYPVPGA
jgi:hypothetical protein